MNKKIMIALKIMIIFIAIIIVGGIFSIMVNMYVQKYSERYIYAHKDIKNFTTKKVYDAVIIPGALVFSDTSVSPILRDRLLTGYEIYSKGIARKIIVSGDHGSEDYNEVTAMKLFLLELGVPREDIFMDHAGFNTYDTMYRAKNIFCVESAIVVTQEFHVYRAVYIGKMMDIQTLGFSSDLDTYVRESYNNFREYFARNKAFIDTELLNRKPKYGGEQIPVLTSSGLETEDEKARVKFDSLGYGNQGTAEI